jgi:GNAT superfamily N-acetyltransferase
MEEKGPLGIMKQMQPLIRPFTSDDLPTVQALLNVVFPETHSTIEALQSLFDAHRSSSRFFHQWVVVYDQNIVAYGDCKLHQQQQAEIAGFVHPSYKNKGVGSALYNDMFSFLRSYNAPSVKMVVRESRNHSIQFLEARGFQETQREWIASLDVASFDPSPYSGLEAQLQAQSIIFRSLKELESDANYGDKLYALYDELMQQVPSPEPPKRITYYDFVGRLLGSAELVPEGYIIALHDNTYVGMNALYTRPEKDYLFNEFTGVKQGYHKRGIAVALKLRGIAFAKAQGYPTIKTSNSSLNDRIIRLNERLGFIKESAFITFVKVF